MAISTTPEATQDKLLYTVPQAAKRLSLSARTIYSLFNTGALTPIKIGRSTRISAAELTAFVAGLQAAQGGVA